MYALCADSARPFTAVASSSLTSSLVDDGPEHLEALLAKWWELEKNDREFFLERVAAATFFTPGMCTHTILRLHPAA